MPKAETEEDSAAFVERRKRLVELLVRDSPSYAKQFAHLCVFFDNRFGGSGFSFLEDQLITMQMTSAELESRAKGIENAADNLDAVRDTRLEFEYAAAGFLKEFDYRLGNEQPSMLPIEPIQSLDGHACYVRQRSNYLAEIYDNSVGGPRVQGASLFAYARECIAIPVPATAQRPTLRFQSLNWRLAGRLDQIASTPSHEYRVLMWPFPDVELLHHGLRTPTFDEPYTRLAEIEDETRLLQRTQEAIEIAKQQRATVLIFPELSVTPTVEKSIVDVLSQGYYADSYPVLTVFGRTHVAGEQLDSNVGVVMGPDGQLICQHIKLSRYGTDQPCEFFGRKWPKGISERNITGDTVSIFETPIGVFSPLICKDLLTVDVQDLIQQTHIDTLFVPSLSPETRAHQRVTDILRLRNWISSFVTNRCVEPAFSSSRPNWQLVAGQTPSAEDLLRQGSSFFEVARKEGNRLVVCGAVDPNLPYLLFTANPTG